MSLKLSEGKIKVMSSKNSMNDSQAGSSSTSDQKASEIVTLPVLKYRGVRMLRGVNGSQRFASRTSGHAFG